MPPKALFFNIPGHGHVNPSLPLVTELVRRGHGVTYFNTPGFREKVEATGAEFHPYSGLHDDFFHRGGLHGGVPQQVAAALMATAEILLPDLVSYARDAAPDYVLYDAMSPWGYAVAKVLGVPGVVSLPVMPPIVPPLSAFLKGPMLRFLLSAFSQDLDKLREATRRARRIGETYGIPPQGPPTLLSAPGDLSIAYTSTAFQPYADRADSSLKFVGWTPINGAGPNPGLFEAAGERPIVYVSLGTVNNANRPLFETFIQAFAGRPEYVMLTTGGQFEPDAFGVLPENFSVHAWLPQVAVLERANLFVSHGGLNSVHDGLYHGVPMLLCPQQGEQALNAFRVAELGAGLSLAPKKLTVETLNEGADRLQSNRAFSRNAARIGETLRAAGGPAGAADEIDALLKRTVLQKSP